jgi:hypothetical protein
MNLLKHSSTVNNFEVMNRGSNLSNYGNNSTGNTNNVGINDIYSRNPIEIYRDHIRKKMMELQKIYENNDLHYNFY